MVALGSGQGTDIGIERRPVRGDETPILVETSARQIRPGRDADHLKL